MVFKVVAWTICLLVYRWVWEWAIWMRGGDMDGMEDMDGEWGYKWSGGYGWGRGGGKDSCGRYG